jgi:hypothetical protein
MKETAYERLDKHVARTVDQRGRAATREAAKSLVQWC